MLRFPAVAGTFYPSNPQKLTQLIQSFAPPENAPEEISCRACLVPHAGYLYSGHVAAAVYQRIALRKRIIILGVRHFSQGAEAAILSEGSCPPPLCHVPIDPDLPPHISLAPPLLP